MTTPGATDPLIDLVGQAAIDSDAFVARAAAVLRKRVSNDSGSIDRDLIDREQHRVHGFAWYATYAAVLHETARWARELSDRAEFGTVETALLRVLAGEYAGQLRHGIAMNQGEVVRPTHLVAGSDLALLDTRALLELEGIGGEQAVKSELAGYLAEDHGRATLENTGLDETSEAIRDQFNAFSRDKVAHHAHDWHLRDELIPMALVEELGEMGVFGLTIPEEFGGLGLGKTAMCVVSEELSRGWIGVGSLATRSEIATELILSGGTDEQKRQWLPAIASAQILPTAVFTEPDTGSDLGSLRTKAVLSDGEYRVTGNKTWITHAARADLMTLLVRTDAQVPGYGGLSMLLAPKPRGTESDPFPAAGMTGGEIGVIGYRGMKEFEIGFDGFRVDAANLLGGVEGRGFKQLMATFESARIQTAARAIGVAQAALDVGLAYSMARRQFDRSIIAFPRVANKLAMIAAEIMATRQLTYFAALRKDEGKRCDLEAGMAKLLGARVAWAAADNALQIHGGNGFATEYEVSRLLADARILNIFEGAGEIQAQVIARRLLEEAN